MNNEQFRRLIQDGSATPKPQGTNSANGGQDGAFKASAFGSRMRSSIPMTPRSVSAATASTDFARQLNEYKARNGEGQPPTKKFKSSAAPKGTKLASGYVDRTAMRRADEEPSPAAEDDGKRKRLQALEEMMKLGQLDMETFLKLRHELGFEGEYGESTERKGLDFALLERTRRGEVEANTNGDAEDATAPSPSVEEDFEVALDAKAEEDVTPIQREAHSKKGNLAAPAPLSSEEARKMSRDEILKRLKASRAAATATRQDNNEPQAQMESTLGSKFKKVRGPEKKRWIETDDTGRRREVLLTTDKDGNPKRKVRWLDKEPPAMHRQAQEKATKPANGKSDVLGMEVPAEVLARQAASQAQVQEEEDDDDIFAGVGTDYNPLGHEADSDNSDESGSEEGEHAGIKSAKVKSTEDKPTATMDTTSRPRNYFSESTSNSRPTESDPQAQSTSSNPLIADPALLAALKRAASIRKAQESSPSTTEAQASESFTHDDPDAETRRLKLLETLRKRDRDDAADLDLGFGDSRFGDDDEDEEGEGKPRKLAEWRGGADGDDDDEGHDESSKRKSAGGSGGRKRGPKKRKANKESFSDVMKVIEGRKNAQ